MNTLEECGRGIWGSRECLEKLAAAESARLLLISDTHERVAILRRILKDFGASCDALLFAGDGVSDIVECREEAIAEENVRAILPPVIAVVSGNGDLPVYQVTSEKNPDERLFFRVPLIQILDICGKRILLAHGHLYSANHSLQPLAKLARSNECQILVYGHTHVAAAKDLKPVFAINPGSICLPREDSEASFAVLSVSARLDAPEYSFYPPQEGIPPIGKKPGQRRFELTR